MAQGEYRIMIKVAHIYKDFYPISGGIENIIYLLSKEILPHAKTEVFVSARGFFREKIEFDGIEVVKLPELVRLNSMPILPTLYQELKRSDADLFHFHHPFPMGDLSYILSGSKKPFIISYHSDVVRQRVSNIFYQPLQNAFFHRAKKIIVSSENYIKASPVLTKWQEKCIVIPYGIDVRFFSPAGTSDDLISHIRHKYGERIVLFVGVLRYYKGVDVLIEAMKYVDGKLIIIGRGPEWFNLNRLVYKNKLYNKVILENSVTNFNLLPYYRACDVFVLPSIYRSEAFGIVLLEAMACGKPVISTELGTGTSWVNQHNQTGFVVPPGDPMALAEAINRLLDDKELARKFGENGRKRVIENFTKELMAERVLRVYKEVLGE